MEHGCFCLFQGCPADTVFIHGQHFTDGTVYLINLADFFIRRVLQTIDPLAAQKGYKEPVKVFRSRTDHDLLFSYIYSSVSVQIIRDCLAENIASEGR